jgi:hypothetical protein
VQPQQDNVLLRFFFFEHLWILKQDGLVPAGAIGITVHSVLPFFLHLRYNAPVTFFQRHL